MFSLEKSRGGGGGGGTGIGSRNLTVKFNHL